MFQKLPLLCAVLLPTCALFQRPPRPVHAPPEVAEQFKFPMDVPEEGRQIIKGDVVRAIQLAIEDFYPWDKKPPDAERSGKECLYRRESYSVITAPAGNDVILVDIFLAPDACGDKAVPSDLGALYAIDTRHWRILAIRR
jgi:hypothetical protein